MLPGLDDIDWPALTHAYGPANDIPGVLRDLASLDDEAVEEATDYLFGSIYHQGTLYSATPYAVPFIARLAADAGTRGRTSLVHLLSAIAAAEDASDAIRNDVDAALVREIGILLALLDDLDADIRHAATYVLGHLPSETAGQVLPALRTRREAEPSPLVVAGLLAAAARLAPLDSADWLEAELAPANPDAVRAGALWASVTAGLPWSDEAAAAFGDCWSQGEPLQGWIWAPRPFEEIVSRLDDASFAAFNRAMLDRTPDAALDRTPDAALAAVNAVYERCVGSRAARIRLAPLLAEAVGHPDLGVRVAAAFAVRDVREAAPRVAESLAAFLSAAPPGGFRDVTSDEGRLFNLALEILIGLGDDRWREPFCAALRAGRLTTDVLRLPAESESPCDPAILTALRERLAALPTRMEPGDEDWRHWHNEGTLLTYLPLKWGPDAAEAVPELIALVPDDRWHAVRALGAIGKAASSAVPVLTRVHDDTTASWKQRLACAGALAAITGDSGPLGSAIPAAAADGEGLLAARTALQHDLPLDGLLDALREAAAPGDDPAPEDPGVYQDRIEASRILLHAGETAPAIHAAADALDAGRYTRDALELAGLLGRAGAELDRRVRKRLHDRHDYDVAALAFFRITGESEPLVEALRLRVRQVGVGTWFVDALRELGEDALPLLPELEELAHGDAPISRFGVYGGQVRADEEERARLISVLGELDG
ncbi:hypothetical protein [Actinomadura rupiterrae]|uniref:hypothetical protein n=1 Tax=Actinomadura rupiterrae TaxID=559627 RepID=UPI0020A39AFF|nr:hypothetical protein [Actinomadura rupiterrae]MCP2339923.1 hypothetical protein [Actinomadura rupiterrae]